MRIIAGAWRGRTLLAPAGSGTRPTADRVRQALFDAIVHAPWATWDPAFTGLRVLDAFAGTGALGLEALSRGAAHASFFERDRAALDVLRQNVRACGAGPRAEVRAVDATRPPPPAAPCGLVFLDPPYRRGLVPAALAALGAAGWFAPGAVAVAETGPEEELAEEEWAEEEWAGEVLFDRRYGAARIRAVRVGR